MLSPCFEGGPSVAEHPVSFAGPVGFARHYFCRPLSSASVYGHTQQQLAIDIPPLASVDDGDQITQRVFGCHLSFTQVVGKDIYSFYRVVYVISDA